MMFNVEFNEESCHICLSNDGAKEHINENDLKSKYLELTMVELLHAKGMPSYICEFCKSKLIIAVHFKKQCMMSHKLLQKYFEDIIQAEKAEESETVEILTTIEVAENENITKELATETKVDDTEMSTEVEVLEQIDEEFVEEPEKKVVNKRKPILQKRRFTRKRQRQIEPIEMKEEDDDEEEQVEQEVKEPEEEYEKSDEPKILELGEYNIQIGTDDDDDDDDDGKSNDGKKETCISIIEVKGLKNIERTTNGKKYKVFDGKRVSYMSLCPICNKMQFNIKQHMSVHTGEKKHKCPHCDKAFAQKGNLNHHINIHTGHKPYQCKVCEKSFSEPNSLRSHMIFHTKEKNYHCEVCGKKFGYPHTLTAHKRTHTNERPYSCDICNKSFLVRHTLIKHIRTHTGEKPYKCETCGKGFTSSGNLSAHRIVHTKIRRFDCHMCDMKFSYKNVLKTHMKVHNIKDDDISIVSENEENSPESE